MDAPRMRSVMSTAMAPPARAAPSSKAMVTFFMSSLRALSAIRHLANRDRAFLEIRLQRDGACRIEGHLVDELAGIEPRYEHQTLRRFVAAARFNPCLHRSPARDQFDNVAASHIERAGIVCVHVADCVGKGSVKLRHA